MIENELQALKQRWDGFVGKFWARIQEVGVEADSGLSGIIAEHALDPGPVGAAFQAVTARYHGLIKKIDEATEKLDSEVDALRERGLERADETALEGLWSYVHGHSARLTREIERLRDELLLRKKAEHAHALMVAVQKEAAQPVPCSACGAPLRVEVYWKTHNVTCPHCRSVVSLNPGVGSQYFFMGSGVDAMASWEAREQLLASKQAYDRYRWLRRPTAADHEAVVAAMRGFWLRYYQEVKRIDPNFEGDPTSAAAARVEQEIPDQSAPEHTEREAYGHAVAAAAARDRQALASLVRASRIDLDEAAHAAIERGDRDGTVMILELKHELEREDEPRDRFVRNELLRLEHDLLARG